MNRIKPKIRDPFLSQAHGGPPARISPSFTQGRSSRRSGGLISLFEEMPDQAARNFRRLRFSSRRRRNAVRPIEIGLANGAPAESFVDNVSRRTFDNYVEFEALHGENPTEMKELPYPRASNARHLPERIKARLDIGAGKNSAA